VVEGVEEEAMAAFVLGVAPRRFLLGFLLAHVPMEGSRAARMTPLNQ
jgi:hypothetical protein